MGGRSIYKVLVKVAFNTINHSLYKRFSAGHHDGIYCFSRYEEIEVIKYVPKNIQLSKDLAQTVKASAYNVGDLGSIPGLETWVRSLGWEDMPGEGNGNPLQYSCLENPMDGWRSLVGYSPWGHKELDRTETLFFWAPKSLQMVTSATKLKDAYSLEGKL